MNRVLVGLLLVVSFQAKSQFCRCPSMNDSNWVRIDTGLLSWYKLSGNDSTYVGIIGRDTMLYTIQRYSDDNLTYRIVCYPRNGVPSYYLNFSGGNGFGFENSPRDLSLTSYYHLHNDTLTETRYYSNGRLQSIRRTTVFNDIIDSPARQYELFEYRLYDDQGHLVREDTMFTSDPHKVYTYYPNGAIYGEYSVRGDDIYHGPFTEFYETGEIKASGSYTNSIADGIWTMYDKQGNIILKEEFEATSEDWEWLFRDGTLRE